MTGMVTWEAAAFLFSAICVAGGCVAGFLFWVWRIVVGLRTQASADIGKLEREMKERDSAAQLEKERAKLIEEGLRKQITGQAQHVAETYATKDGVQAGLGRVEKSIDRLGEQVGAAVERLSSRLDRIFEGRDQAPPKAR